MKIKTKKVFFILANIIIVSAMLLYYAGLENTFASTVNETTIYLLSVIGLLLFVYIILSGRAFSKKTITLYNAFMLMFLLFNFGHCILWVFGIHIHGEIGSTSLYTLDPATPLTIIKAQIAAIVSMVSLHSGAIAFLDKKIDASTAEEDKRMVDEKKMLNANLVIYAISAIATIIVLVSSIHISQSYGYRSLYYGEYAHNSNTLIIHLSKLFIPSLIGILIFSDYDKKYSKLVYISFALYAIAWLICGDRGAWIYPLLVFIVLHNAYHKKINKRSMILYGIIAVISLAVLNAIVQTRNQEFSLSTISSAIDYENNPVNTEILEMGNTMRVAATVIQYKDQINYPHGNTFINGFICMASENIMLLFNHNYVNLSTWFSKNFLAIDYGAGFSFVAEILFNYDVMAIPICSIILGLVISILFSLHESYINDKKRILSASIAFLCIAPICRGPLQTTLKSFFYTYIVYFVILAILNRSTIKNNNRIQNEKKLPM